MKGKPNVQKINVVLFVCFAAILTRDAIRWEAYWMFGGSLLCLGIAFYTYGLASKK